MPRLESSHPMKTYREHISELGNSVWKWNNDHTCTGSEEVVTSGCVYNLPSDKTFYISSIGMHILTVNKNCTFELVKCSAIDGAGTASPISMKWTLVLGAAQVEVVPSRIMLQTPIKIVYSTAKSISFRVNGGDNATHINCEWKGWYE